LVIVLCALAHECTGIAGSSSLARTARFTTPKLLLVLHTYIGFVHASATVIAVEVLLAILLRKSIHPHPEQPITAVATPTCSANSGPRQCNREAVLFSAESCCSCLFFFSFIALACTLFRLTTETHPRHMQDKTVRRSNCGTHRALFQ
jgi:hypothetical protein